MSSHIESKIIRTFRT